MTNNHTHHDDDQLREFARQTIIIALNPDAPSSDTDRYLGWKPNSQLDHIGFLPPQAAEGNLKFFLFHDGRNWREDPSIKVIRSILKGGGVLDDIVASELADCLPDEKEADTDDVVFPSVSVSAHYDLKSKSISKPSEEDIKIWLTGILQETRYKTIINDPILIKELDTDTLQVEPSLKIEFLGTPERIETNQGVMWIGFIRLGSIDSHRQVLSELHNNPATILEHNIRHYLAGTRINIGLIRAFQNLQDEENEKTFAIMHNGITLASPHVEEEGDKTLRLSFARIINGAQTVFAYNEARAERGNKLRDPWVMAKVVKRVQVGEEGEEFIRRVTKANNRQNAISLWQLTSVDPRQRDLEKQYNRLGIDYRYKTGRARGPATFKSVHLLDFATMRFLLFRDDLEHALCGDRAMDRQLDQDDSYDDLFPINGLPDEELCRIFVAHQAWKYFRNKTEKHGCPIVLRRWTYKWKDNQDNPLIALTWPGPKAGPGKGSKTEFREAIRDLAFAIALRTPQIILKDLFEIALNDKDAFRESLRDQVGKFFKNSLKPLFTEKEPYRMSPYLVEVEVEEEDETYQNLLWEKQAFTKNDVLDEIEERLR